MRESRRERTTSGRTGSGHSAFAKTENHGADNPRRGHLPIVWRGRSQPNLVPASNAEWPDPISAGASNAEWPDPINRRVLAMNVRWGNSTATTSTFLQVGAFPLASGSQDSAVVTDLLPGSYTVVATSRRQTGFVLLEVYDLDP